MTSANALSVAQRFISAIEARDSRTAVALLADGSSQTFPFSGDASSAHGPVFDGKEELTYYVESLFTKFSSLRWPNARWTGSEDGTCAFMEARGDAIVAHSGKPYHNTYATRFDVVDDLIKEITEYTNMDVYMAQGIPGTDHDIRAVACGLNRQRL